MKTSHRALALAAVATAVTALYGCKSNSAGFHDRIFACDIAATEDVCGTTRGGQPMICHSVSQLGGTDFCAPACDVNTPAPLGTACIGAGALVETCRPSAGSADCPTGLNCYRTDLADDQGLCLNIPVCKQTADCVDPARRLCAGDLVKISYPGVPLATDGLHCLQAGCKTTSTECPSGESCLPVALPVSDVPDICVPNCDANMRCPPNFVCSRAVSGPAAPLVCVPGLPGARCAGPQDCMIGNCENTDVGFSVCTLPCATDADCRVLVSDRDPFVCAHRPSDGAGHCVSPSPFAGSPCLLEKDCPFDLDCFMYSAYQTMAVGECRLPCGEAGECPARGGVPHVCLAGGAGGCYPGRFGLPCTDSSQCMAGFTCEAVTSEIATTGPSMQKVCTEACAADADCDANPWTLKEGYCGGGYCQLGAGTDEHCERDAHCRTRRCQLPPAGSGTCLLDPPP